MLAHSRAIIVFADNCHGEDVQACQHNSLNRIAEGGVTGWLTFRRPDRGGRNGGVALAQLLGVMPDYIASAGGDLGKLAGFEKGASGSVRMKDRFCGMDVRVITNQPVAVGLQSSLGVPCKLVETDFGRSENAARESAEAIIKAMNEVSQEAGAEVVILHLDADAGGESAEGSMHQLVGRPHYMPSILHLLLRFHPLACSFKGSPNHSSSSLVEMQ